MRSGLWPKSKAKKITKKTQTHVDIDPRKSCHRECASSSMMQDSAPVACPMGRLAGAMLQGCRAVAVGWRTAPDGMYVPTVPCVNESRKMQAGRDRLDVMLTSLYQQQYFLFDSFDQRSGDAAVSV